MIKIWLTLGFFALIGCTSMNDSAEKKFMLPFIDKDGTESIQEVTLDTLVSPRSLEGSVATIYLRGSIDKTIEGRTAVRVTKQGDTWIPLDTTSAQGLALYHIMENIYRREKSWGVADKVSWPRKIGVDFRVASNFSERAEYLNNSIYISSADSVAHYHSDDVEHATTAIDESVASHEQFHGYFEIEFIKKWKQILAKALPDKNFSDKILLDNFLANYNLDDLSYAFGLMLSWNEGLADFWAYAHTGYTEFGSVSAPQPQRALSTNSYERLYFGEDTHIRLSTCGEKSCAIRRSLKYEVGTNLGRWLFKIAKFWPGGREELPKFIVNKLPSMANAFANKYLSLSKAHRMGDVGNEWFLEELFADESELSPQICGVIKEAFYSANEQRGFQIHFEELCHASR